MQSAEYQLCGHNIKEFDVPYIARRMLINGLPLPDVLQIGWKKTIGVKFLDTLELWRFGDYKELYLIKTFNSNFLIFPLPKTILMEGGSNCVLRTWRHKIE